MAKESKVRWAAEPQEHDYPAAAVFLGLVLSPERVSSVVESLRRTPTTHHRANDLLRASYHLDEDAGIPARMAAPAGR